MQIVPVDKKMFNEMEGAVVPSYFWNNAEDFEKNSVGFSLLCDGQLASMAYATFIHDNKLEIGIETLSSYRGRGYAPRVCTALIDYCLEQSYEPIWACRLDNSNSYKLAQKLGFEPTLQIPYYKI